MTYYLLGGLVVLSVVLVMYALWPSDGDKGEAIKRRMTGRKAQPGEASVREKAKESVAKRVVDTVAPIAARSGMKQDAEEMSKLRMKLASAGFRGDTTPTAFLASKTVVAVALGIAAAGFAWAKGYPLPTAAGVVMIGVGFGFLAPDFWLSAASSKRIMPRSRSSVTVSTPRTRCIRPSSDSAQDTQPPASKRIWNSRNCADNAPTITSKNAVSRNIYLPLDAF